MMQKNWNMNISLNNGAYHPLQHVQRDMKMFKCNCKEKPNKLRSDITRQWYIQRIMAIIR